MGPYACKSLSPSGGVYGGVSIIGTAIPQMKKNLIPILFLLSRGPH